MRQVIFLSFVVFVAVNLMGCATTAKIVSSALIGAGEGVEKGKKDDEPVTQYHQCFTTYSGYSSGVSGGTAITNCN